MKSNKINKEVVMDLLETKSHNEFVELFCDYQPFFIDDSRLVWLWDKEKHVWKVSDIVLIFAEMYKILPKSFNICNSKVYGEISKFINIVGRIRRPKDAKLKWIQFNKTAFSIKSKKIHEVTSDYFFTNAIPWDIGENTLTPTLDKYFEQWVGKKYVQTLYELIAYCCYRDYPIQVAFCFFGGGRNGKSSFLEIVGKFLGENNLSASSLEALSGNNNRFETFNLYKKLMCEISETNRGVISNTTMFKNLTGKDNIGFEKKRVDKIVGKNYAKILIGSNSLPISKDETDGYYRRWFIINFPNKFDGLAIDIMNSIPDKEFNNLAKKCCSLLPDIIKTKHIFNLPSIAERKKKYISCSNPIMQFISSFCDKDELGDKSYHIKYSYFNMEYTKYLKYSGMKKVFTSKDFEQALNNLAITTEYHHFKNNGEDPDNFNITEPGIYIMGYKFKDDYIQTKQF